MNVDATTGITFNANQGGTALITINPGSSSLSTLTTAGPLLMQTDASAISQALIEMNNAPLTVTANSLAMNNNSPHGNLFIHSNSLNFAITGNANLNNNAVGGSGFASIYTTGGDLLFNAGGDVALTSQGNSPTNITSGANLTLTANNLSLFQTSLLQANGSSGALLVKAGQNIDLEGNSAIINISGSPGPVTLVVDNNFPTRPQIGPGAFLMSSKTTISATGLLKIFTARPSQNNASGTLQGHPYLSRTEVFNVYYPEADPGRFFTVFYKTPFGTPIIPPTPTNFFGIPQTLGDESDIISILEGFFFPWESSFCISYEKEKGSPLPLSKIKEHFASPSQMSALSNANNIAKWISFEKSSPFEKERKKCYRVKEKTYQKNRKVEG